MIILKGKVALVTGGSRGIGKCIVKQLSSVGYDVAFTYYSSEEEAIRIVKELSDSNRKIKAYKMNIEDRCSIRKTLKKFSEDFKGKIDVLVNNAGVNADSYLMLMNDEKWDKTINININGMYCVIKTVLPDMLRNKKGSIINISSVSGIVGIAGQTNYSASKAAVIGLTKSLSKEVGKMKIRVNSVAPGFIETDMLRNMNIRIVEEIKQKIPLKRFGNPEDVANAVLFLASDKSNYITGQTLIVDGGLIGM